MDWPRMHDRNPHSWTGESNLILNGWNLLIFTNMKLWAPMPSILKHSNFWSNWLVNWNIMKTGRSAEELAAEYLYSPVGIETHNQLFVTEIKIEIEKHEGEHPLRIKPLGCGGTLIFRG